MASEKSVTEKSVTEKSVMAVVRASRPFFRNDQDKVAFVVHASFIASGYFLSAAGPPAFSDTALSSTSTDEVGIDGWNQTGDRYAFVYFNPEKANSKKILVRCLAMFEYLIVIVREDGGSEPLHLLINVGDHVGESQAQGTNYSAYFKSLKKLVQRLSREVLSKLDGSGNASLSGDSTRGVPPQARSDLPVHLQSPPASVFSQAVFYTRRRVTGMRPGLEHLIGRR